MDSIGSWGFGGGARLTGMQIIDFGFSFSLFYAVRKGLGLHSSEIRKQDELAFNKANYAFTVLYVSMGRPVRAKLANSHPEPGVDGRQNLNPDILLDFDSESESLSLRKLCHLVYRERRGPGIDIGQRLPVQPAWRSFSLRHSGLCALYGYRHAVLVLLSGEYHHRHRDPHSPDAAPDENAPTLQTKDHPGYHILLWFLRGGSRCDSNRIPSTSRHLSFAGS